MPAHDYTDRKPDANYDLRKQKALFKLWLLLTTEPFIYKHSVHVFKSTAETKEFIERQKDIPETTYYIDVEKLCRKLEPLGCDLVRKGFSDMELQKDVLLGAAQLFHDLGTTRGSGSGYGNGQCVACKDVLHIDECR
jgi:hypothetical protein